MRIIPLVLIALPSVAFAQAHDSMGHTHTAGMSHADSTFSGTQTRGKAVMGVDQYTSAHRFEDLPDGGRIVLERSVDDPAGVAQIRRHMQEIAGDFTRGAFTKPFQVHDTVVPGTAVMKARRSAITYRAADLPHGGLVRITTTDPAAVRAIHDFLAYQRREHRVN